MHSNVGLIVFQSFSLAALLSEALRNKAFEANIPFMDKSLKDILQVAKVFSNNLFEFFVSSGHEILFSFLFLSLTYLRCSDY